MPRLLSELAAPIGQVRQAALSLGAKPEPDGSLVLETPFRTGDPHIVSVELASSANGTTLHLSVEPPPRVPYYQWFIGPILRAADRRALQAAQSRIEAQVAGLPAPSPPRRFFLAPPSPFEPRQAVLLAVVCTLTTVATLGTSLFGQFVDFVAESFGASNRDLGFALAAARIGVVVSLAASALSDKRGRRILLLGSFAGMAAASALSAVAPNLLIFTSAQVLVRGFGNATLTLAIIAAIEESPEGARAYSLGLLALAGGAGYAIGTALLPVADLAPQAWRVAFATSAASGLMLPSLTKQLKETGRFTELAGRTRSLGRASEVLDATYGPRFRLLLAMTFLNAIAVAGSSQFTNRYLADERGFSGLGISLFRGATQAVPGLVGVALGGALAETRGRRPVASLGLLGATLAEIAFFLTGGPMMWVASAVYITVGAIAVPSLGAFGGELFPTEVRGTASGLLLVAGVVGSVIGLIAVGILSKPLGGLGPALALTGLTTLVSAMFLVPRLPEPAARRLDEVSPPEV
ncbi:MAG: MFS transporter [Acidimicrobiia bacterium]